MENYLLNCQKENPSKEKKKDTLQKRRKVIGEMMLVEYQDDLILKVKIGEVKHTNLYR